MAWSFNEHNPVWLQIANRLKMDIINGIYKPNEQIPTVRQLAVEAAVNPNTVQRALSSLEEEGIICSAGTVGRFVTDNEEILSAARKTAVTELVCEFIKRAEQMSISPAELINLIEEESGL